MKDAPIQVCDHVRYWALNHPEAHAVEIGERALTWRALDQGSDEIAAGLLSSGLAPGDRVSALLESGFEFVELAAACTKTGILLSPLNVRLTSFELAHQIRDAGSRAVITQASLSDRLGAAAPELEGAAVYCLDGVAGPRYETLRQTGAPPVRLASPDGGLFLCYTSGTTGAPKAALLTDAGVRASGIAKNIADGVTFEDRILSLAPMCLTAGVVANLTQVAFLMGSTLVVGQTMDPEAVLDLVIRKHITTMAMVPIGFERMSHAKNFAAADLGRLRHVTSGGPDLTEDLVRRYLDKGVSLDPSFGQTESSSIATWARRSRMGRRLRASGRPIMHTQIRVVDEQDQDMPIGEAGEILIRGPGVMKGYWNKPDATAETLRGGWLHTGDVGSLDEAGYLFVHDRKKDMIRSGGMNIYPAEVEQAILSALPLTAEIAVVGVPDSRWGEVGLLVVAGGLQPDLARVRGAMDERLARYKHPRHMVIIQGPLPRNASGKVRKVDLRAQFNPPTQDLGCFRLINES